MLSSLAKPQLNMLNRLLANISSLNIGLIKNSVLKLTVSMPVSHLFENEKMLKCQEPVRVKLYANHAKLSTLPLSSG